MQQPLLSKSSFKIARSCATKLYYLTNRYPSTKTENPYLEFLADGGFMVGKIAKLLHPEGIDLEELSGSPEQLRDATAAELQNSHTTLFEPAVLTSGLIARIDILKKQQNTVELIEVKSKSYDSDENQKKRLKNGKGLFWLAKGDALQADWREYLEDITFQVIAFEKAYPKLTVKPYLLLPDKAKTTSIDNLFSYFTLNASDKTPSGYRKVTVEFSGDAEKLRNDHFLTKVDVSAEVELLRPEVSAAIDTFLASLTDGITKIPSPLGKQCKTCEFHAPEKPSSAPDSKPTDLDQRSGFHECLGPLADVSPHIFELYHIGSLKSGSEFLLDTLLQQGSASLYDVPPQLIKGTRGTRQQLQISHTKSNSEWFSPELKTILNSAKYPLHFIDFETTRISVPYHPGMRPYEQLAFQFSCHTFTAPGAAPTHTQWLNTENRFPNFHFAQNLRRAAGSTGSILVWAQHEQSVLKDILHQLQKYNASNSELETWIKQTIGLGTEPSRLIDLNKVTLDHYFHPEMKSSTSLKYVLPAIWKTNPRLQQIPWLKKYAEFQDGTAINPYQTLPPLLIAGESRVVDEGTAAMRAYQEMVFGLSSSDAGEKGKLERLLLQYCELDTLAMAVVWEHWRGECIGF